MEPSSKPLDLTPYQQERLRRFAYGLKIPHRTFRVLVRLGLIAPDMFKPGHSLTEDGRRQLGLTDGR